MNRGKQLVRIGLLLAAAIPLGSVLPTAAVPAILLGAPSLLRAQGDAEEEPEAEEEPAAAPAPASGSPADNAGQGSRDETILSWAFRSLGKGYSLIFLSLSFALVALFVMNLVTARRENVLPAQLMAHFEGLLNEKKYQEAYDLAKENESFLGRILTAGLSKLSLASYSQAVEAMQEVGEDENMVMEHRLSYMALIGTISPMIGLFGTVHGMIASFQVIATSTTAPKPAELAQGISTALFTTLVGLFIAIPAIAAYNILRNRVARLVLEVGIESERLLGRFQNQGARRTPPDAGAAAAGPQAPTAPAPPSGGPQAT